MKMTAALRNGIYGKTLETVIILPELPGIEDMGRKGTSQLKIYTTKNSRGIVQSHVSVEFDMGNGSTMTRFPDDFSKFLTPKTIVKRATEKALQIVHDETMADFEAIKAQALAHYGV